MKYEEFLSPYHEDERKYDTYEGNQADVLNKADRWSDFFSDSLYDVLDNTARTDTMDDILKSITSYAAWSTHELGPVQKSILEIKSERSQRLANRLNFHTLNNAFLPQWLSLMGEDRYKNAYEARSTGTFTQNLLAMEALKIMRLREAVPVDEYYQADAKSPALKRAAYEGILTEIDAGIVLLEATKFDSNLLVVPSPSLFEHGDRSARNSDFIVMDRSTRDVAGVQVKSSSREEDIERYDSKRIVIVDGSMDFDNVSLRAGKLRKIKATAGLISAAHLQYIPTHNNKRKSGALPYPDNREIMQAKMYAREVVAGDAKPAIRTASDRIALRVLSSLYKQ